MVRNSGCAALPQTLGQLGSRFARGDTIASGAGPGLAIVRAIMEQSGGAMELASPIEGESQGFEVRLTFAV